ncbi:sensor histidine kinase [Paenibacillus tuaregi]|uniref:sensor histidine kinase n=1 Tax=Paenibacillus tuaregi TaxID=1816681 RepID=UPI00083968A8|nr:HAMP domain-containing sensor histidine kinase [Paenibacillus tuaregi]
MRSLRGRLLFSLIAGMFITVGITVFLFVQLIHSLTIDQAKTELHSQIDKAIQILDDGDIHDIDDKDLKLKFKDRLYYADFFILNEQHKIVAASDAKRINAVIHVPLEKEDGIMELDHRKMLYATKTLDEDEKLQIVVFAPLSSLRTIVGQLLGTTIIAILGSFLFVLGIGLLAIWKTTRPLKKLTAAVSQYEPYRSHHPVLPKADRTEIGELIDTFQEMSERINKHHGYQIEFLQNVSHELRTPLMSIQGYALAIKDQVVTVDQGLDVIHKEAQRMVHMVERLLQLSKLEYVEDVWTFSQEDLRNMAEQAVDLLTPAASEKGITLSITGSSSINTLLPAEQIFQVLLNLLQNAVRYARSQVVIELNAGPAGSSSESLLQKSWSFHIDDDGEGVAEKDCEAIFERFYKGREGVTGLGLAICRQIAERLGSTMSCERSALGGARFSFVYRAE